MLGLRFHANEANKILVPRLEIQNEAYKRAVPPRNGEVLRRGCGGGGGDDSGWGDVGGDFSGGDLDIPDSSTPIENIDIPTIEVHGHIDSPTINIPTVEVHGQLPDNQLSNDPIPVSVTNAIDPQLIAKNENKGFSWKCAVHSVLEGWEAGLACSLLEEKYPPSAPPKNPPPPAPKPAPHSPPPQAPAPAPKKSNGGWQAVGPMKAVPRGISLVLR